MSSPPGKHRPPRLLAQRTPNAAPAPALEDDLSINAPLALTLNPPSSLNQCTPANITWTGGTPPYSLSASLTFEDTATSPASQWGSSMGLGTELSSIGLIWSINVFQGSRVSFQVTDGNGVQASSPQPLPVGPSEAQCRLAFPPPLAGVTFVQDASPSGVLSSTGTSTTAAPPPSLTLSTSQAAVQSGVSLDGTSIALIILGVVVFLLIACLLLRWSFIKTRRRDSRKEKQDASCESDGDGPSYHLASPTTNPFDDPENVVHTEHNFIALPMSNDEDGPSTHFSLHDPTTTAPRRGSECAVDDSATAKPRSEEITLMWGRTPSVSTQSESDTRTLSDMDAVRLSITTSSTLPPSYRTRGSTSSIDVPIREYPPFPPPLYTLQVAGAPPSAFKTPRRAP